ncbi:hypothetical protein N7G274_004583 [Stereocaulon virgatum]|uniref:Rhodopsin domain-containing protein n=1 Tax=Stereocaulon virgatum TaxID=373712 RepID=A0ABR4AAQ4_9LECA
MSMSSIYDHGRVPKDAYLASSVALFVIAILAAIARTILRIHYQNRLFIDDGFLLLAVLFAVVCMGLLPQFLDATYLLQAHLEARVPPGTTEEQVNAATLRFHLYSDVLNSLSFTIVFAIKFSFLSFFKQLIRRIRKLEIYWWYVVGVTAVTWIAGFVGIYASCSYFDERALACASSINATTIALYCILAFLDVATDIAIIMIPVLFLRKVRIKLRTKIFLGASLCLSAIIITVVITQIAGFHVPGTNIVDVVWEMYWQFVEAMVAIIIVCLSAFRSFFVQHTTRHQSPPQRSWYAGVKASLTNKSSQDGACELSPIPGVAPTGMRTYIEVVGGESSDHIIRHEASVVPPVPQHDPAEAQTITVRHDLSMSWEPSLREDDSFV